MVYIGMQNISERVICENTVFFYAMNIYRNIILRALERAGESAKLEQSCIKESVEKRHHQSSLENNSKISTFYNAPVDHCQVSLAQE